ncbi:MAG: alpha/beta hydrolase [Deltaproteobacteria bacterium]|nr:MAG: alpha/beta hydrolase [Deltaproteobacteria bacterium]
MTLPVDGGIDADVWEGTRGTVLVLHGVSVLEHRDPTQVHICAALAELGFRVVSPRLPAVSALHLSTGLPARIGQVIRAVADDPLLADHGAIALIGQSISGSLALCAMEDPETCARVRAVLGLGCYGAPGEVLDAVLQGRGAAPYLRLLLYAHVLPDAWKLGDEGRRLLELAARDAGLRRSHPELPFALRAATPAVARQVRAVVGGSQRREAALTVTAVLGSRMAALTPASHPRMGCPITLLHGRHDPHIPSAQSLALGRRLTAHGAPVSACITPLVGQPEVASAGPEIERVGRAVTRFLAQA